MRSRQNSYLNSILMRYLCLLLIFALAVFQHLPATAAPAPLSIVAQNRSSYKIVIPQNAPTSLRNAAKELQETVQEATGASLALQQDDAAVTAPYISLGATKQAQTANLLQRTIAEEGFSILTRDGNLYIWGPDTANGQTTVNGGISNGTANGIYSFLEDYLDARWLLPGDLGRDVPRRDTLSLPAIDRTQAPGFINRREPYIQNGRPAVQRWQAQQKLGFSFRIDHAHNWEIVEPELHKEHPDWFPLIDGKRTVPTGRYKLETTNPGLVRFFADRAIEDLKANPKKTFSLSPSDSRGWSQSPESLALWDPTPPGGDHPSVTPLILKFYRDVAQIVKDEYPQGRLAGYIYADYLFPPTKGGMTLPDNFYPVVAPSINYGYTLYREDIQKQFRDLMRDWSKVTQNLFYYDLPNTAGPSGGALLPAAPEILNAIFPVLIENKVKGVYIYGTDSWNNAAMANYILAKMMWNPKLDAVVLQREWLHRAYGPQAGAVMETLYNRLDDLFRDYYRKNHSATYNLTEDMWKSIYAPHFAELEKLIVQAKAQPMTEPQARRLQLLEDNMAVMFWLLQNKKLLPADYKSSFSRDAQTINTLLFSPNADFDLFPGVAAKAPATPRVTVSAGAALAQAPAQTATIRGQSAMLLYAPQAGEVRIKAVRATHGAPFVSYVLQDAQSKVISTGALNAGQTVTFNAQAQTPYYFYIPNGITELAIEGATAAYQTNLEEGAQFHLYGKGTTLYYYVPAAVKSWDLTLSSAVPGETGKLIVTAPGGQTSVLETVTIPSQRVTLDGQEGFWKIELTQASSGIIDDVYLIFDRNLPQWVSTNPGAPLMVR